MPEPAAEGILPVHCRNTAVSCLSCLAAAFHLDLPFEHVAGLTGEAFRLPLFELAAPGSWTRSTGLPQAALHWCEMLGIDAEICWSEAAAQSAPAWLDRQRGMISDTLATGLPVMYWDNLAFGLILAEDARGYQVSGIPELHIPAGLESAGPLRQRSFGPQGNPEGSFLLPPEGLRPLYEGELLFIHPRGRISLDPDYQLSQALRRAAEELGGLVCWPRQLDSAGQRLQPLYGTRALERLEQELRGGELSLPGLIEALQNLLEMRRAGLRWLADVAAGAENDLQPRLKQAAEFMRRIVAGIRPLADDFSPPFDPLRHQRRELLTRTAEQLYEIRRTEETLTRLLRGIAGDFGVFD